MFYLNKLLDNFKATNDLLLSVAKKHNALSSIINNGDCVLQDVIDNNNSFIDDLRNHQKNGGWISVDNDFPTLTIQEALNNLQAGKEVEFRYSSLSAWLPLTLNSRFDMQSLAFAEFRIVQEKELSKQKQPKEIIQAMLESGWRAVDDELPNPE